MVEFTRPAEEWSNGLTWRWFMVGDIEYKLGHHDAEQYSYITLASQEHIVDGWRRTRDRQMPFFYNTRIDGIITPEAAVQIIQITNGSHSTGLTRGYAAAQSDIRKALGL